MEILFTELKPSQVSAAILHHEMNAFNTFSEPDKVKEETFTAYEVTERGLRFTIPKCSVMSIRVKG